MSDIRLWLTLIPFFYTARTRVKSGRDFLYLVLSQWGFGLILLKLLSENGFGIVLLNYMLGYIAFISIYEIGYFANDIWDAKRVDSGRTRFKSDVTTLFISSFISIRISMWIILTYRFFLGDLTFWLIGNVALIVVFSAHNIIRASDVRYATFVQLALLRFALPMMFSLPKGALEPIIIVGCLHYVYFRGLAYLDSKNLLVMPQRKQSNFGFQHTIILLPIVVCLYSATDLILYPVAWGYTAAIYGLFSLWSRRSS
jgi:hypothetical protein